MLTRGKVFALCSILLGIPPPSSLITSYASERLLRCSKHMVIYLQMHKARNTMIRGLSEGNCLLKVEPVIRRINVHARMPPFLSIISANFN